MLNIFICGSAGRIKHDLLSALNKRRKGKRRLINNPTAAVKQQLKVDEVQNLEEDEVVAFYREIIQQLVQQEDQESSGFITDYTVVDALVEAEGLLGRSAGQIQTPAIDKYHTGLVLLVEPMPSKYVDEDHRLECGHVAERYKSLLNLLQIPFMELRDPTLQVMVREVDKAIQGEIPLQTSRLQRFQRNMGVTEQIKYTAHFAFFLPEPENFRLHIKKIQITEYESKQSWDSIDPGKTRRFVARYGSNDLALMSFDINVKAHVVESMLTGGVTINGSLYSFLGCSSQGLKNRTCYLWKGTKDEAEEKIMDCGNFNKITSIPKRMSRIGLLFSGVTLTNVEIKDEQTVLIDDIERNNNCFTDGCGAIGKDLARKVYNSLMSDADPSEVNKDTTPSVFQIRLQGYKGVLALDLDLGNGIQVRKSMVKFKTNQFPMLGVCGYSRPHTFGNLNKQFIMLLSGLGIPDEVFLRKQKEYFDSVKAMTHDHEEAITILQWQNEFDIAQELMLLDNTQEYPERIKRRVEKIQEKLMSKFEKSDKHKGRKKKRETRADKLTILVRNSRTLFGVCDPTGTLQYGECFIRLTVGNKPMTITGKVVVSKNPCYLLGDVRVLTAVEKQDERLKCLVDCIVFPVKGQRPHCSEIAGSDLDGDQYFVTWDEDLIPPRTHGPYHYPASSKDTHQNPIKYFSEQNAVQKATANIDRLYQLWANCEGVCSTQCRTLGQMFSTVIDSGKTGERVHIPQCYQIEQDNRETKRNVWTTLMENATNCLMKYKEKIVEDQRDGLRVQKCSDEFVEEIIEEELTNITDFDKFKFALAHTGNVTDVLEQFGRLINFAFFSKEEKVEAFLHGVNKQLLENALNKSQILLNDELSHFYMQTSLHRWCFFFEAGHSEFQWEHFLRALTQYNRTFIVLCLPDSVVIVLQFLTRHQLGLEQEVPPGTVTSYLYTRRFSYRKKYILGRGYYLDLTTETMQLYRDKQKNKSFIWLKASDFKAKSWDFTLADENVNAVSVDLNRFGSEIQNRVKPHPLITKISFKQIEVYAHDEPEGVPYFDKMDVNYADDVPEVEEPMNETQEVYDDIKITVENMLDCGPDSQIQTVEELLEKLQTDAENGKLLSFKTTIEAWKNKKNAVPNKAQHFISLLLKNIVLCIPPVLLPDPCKTIIVHLLQDLDLSCPKESLATFGFLSQLDLYNIVKDFGKQLKNTLVSRKCFLELCSMWQSWWVLDKEDSFHFLSCLNILDAENPFTGDTWNDNLDVQFTNDYINKFGKLQVMDFLQETETVKEKMKTTKGHSSSGPPNVWLVHVQDDLLTFECRSLGMSSLIPGRFVAIARYQDYIQVPDRRAFMCTGQVLSVTQAPVIICVKITGGIPRMFRQTDTDIKGSLWKMVQLANITSHVRNIEALSRLTPDSEETEPCSPSPYLLQILIHPEMSFKSHLSGVSVESNFDKLKGLIQCQKMAVADAIEHNVSLIQGPPGTGKTTVACHIIRTIFNIKKDYKILVVAETNLAVDNILIKLNGCEDVKDDILRCGSEGGITIGYETDATTKGRLMKLEETSGKRTTYRDSHGVERNRQEQVREVMNKHRIILTTSTGAGSPELKSFTFDFVVLDEATQTKETSLLCALTHGAKQLVMIGDPEQLGPFTVVDNLVHDHLPDVGLLSQTLYHRLFKVLMERFNFLDTQHRMHSSLMKFPSSEFYKGKLVCGLPDKSVPIVIFPWPNPHERLCFINVDGQERKLGTSFYNQKEAEVIKKLLEVILGVPEENFNSRVNYDNITVLTLYQGQVSKIRVVNPLVKVRTVDGFQGQENDLIIVSTVRANGNGTLGFLDDRRRINVLLTRAKLGLIVVGNEETLKYSETWKKWLVDAPHLAEENLKLEEPDNNRDNQGHKSSRQHGSNWNSGRGGGRRPNSDRGGGSTPYSNNGRGQGSQGQNRGRNGESMLDSNIGRGRGSNRRRGGGLVQNSNIGRGRGSNGERGGGFVQDSTMGRGRGSNGGRGGGFVQDSTMGRGRGNEESRYSSSRGNTRPASSGRGGRR